MTAAFITCFVLFEACSIILALYFVWLAELQIVIPHCVILNLHGSLPPPLKTPPFMSQTTFSLLLAFTPTHALAENPHLVYLIIPPGVSSLEGQIILIPSPLFNLNGFFGSNIRSIHVSLSLSLIALVHYLFEHTKIEHTKTGNLREESEKRGFG